MSTNISPETKVGVVDNWSPEKFCDGEQTEVGFRGDTYSADQFKTFLK